MALTKEERMNWKLIVSLSGFGLAMGIASVLGFTRGVEGVLWLIIGLVCAVWIARTTLAKQFLHGFMVGLIGGAIAPLIQVIFFSAYLSNNPETTEQFAQVPVGLSVRSFILVMTPIIGILSGVVLGLLAWAVSKIIKPTANKGLSKRY